MRPRMYTPGAGHMPPELAGRDDLLRDWQVMLNNVRAAGRPSSHDLAFRGLRGVGKSVLLARFAELARDAGYEVLSLQGNPDSALVVSLHQRLQHPIQGRPVWRRALAALDQLTKATVGVAGISVGVEREVSSPAPEVNPEALAKVLADLAEEVRSAQGGGLVLSVDELQMARPQDIRLLGSVLNQLNTVHATAPVVFIGAGLPNVAARMVGPKPDQPYITNPERLLRFVDLDPFLSPAAARQAIVLPALDRNVTWEPAAVEEVVRLSAGYPSHLQIHAAAAWDVGTAAEPVALEHVRSSVVDALAEIETQYLQPRWARLSDRQREYLTALAVCGGRAGSGEVAAVLGTTVTKVSTRRDALIARGEVYDPSYGVVELSMPAMRQYALKHYPALRDESSQDLLTPTEMVTNHREWTQGRHTRLQPTEGFPAELLGAEAGALPAPPPELATGPEPTATTRRDTGDGHGPGST